MHSTVFPANLHNQCGVKGLRSVMSDSLRPHELLPTGLLCPWDFPGKNTGVGCHFLLQGNFPTQVSSPGLPHCRQMLTVFPEHLIISVETPTQLIKTFEMPGFLLSF